MVKSELIAGLNKQAETIQKEMAELQNQFSLKKEQLLKISGALEVLGILDEDEAEPKKEEQPDHSGAMAALSSIGA
jgi:hypothetical protein|tara:strand:+ start:446 stop:673 length:228 start_codon:yes stop_codon:yes gene_type:complete